MASLFIGKEALVKIIDVVGIDLFMDALIHELTLALNQHDKNQTQVMVRNGFVYPAPNVGVLEWMPVMHADGEILVKLVAYNPLNPERHALPTIMSTMALFGSENGMLKVLTDGLFLTAVRTGASSAIASRILANPESRTVGLVGCGAQAITQLHALSRVFKLERALVYDTDPETAASFIKRAAFIPVHIQTISLEELEIQSDIICTATTVGPGEGPVIRGNQLKKNVHINAVGSDLPGKTELPLHVLQKSFICPDFPEQAIYEGECQQLPADTVMGPSFFELVQNQSKYIEFQSGSTVFDSTGFALEDLVAVRLLRKFALEHGFGEIVQVEALPPDPKNPYSCLALAPVLSLI
jgi:ornithine cyclodeaminase/alanine dehydrogenase-like protein (mu-crystallin family)